MFQNWTGSDWNGGYCVIAANGKTKDMIVLYLFLIPHQKPYRWNPLKTFSLMHLLAYLQRISTSRYKKLRQVFHFSLTFYTSVCRGTLLVKCWARRKCSEATCAIFHRTLKHCTGLFAEMGLSFEPEESLVIVVFTLIGIVKLVRALDKNFLGRCIRTHILFVERYVLLSRTVLSLWGLSEVLGGRNYSKPIAYKSLTALTNNITTKKRSIYACMTFNHRQYSDVKITKHWANGSQKNT